MDSGDAAGPSTGKASSSMPPRRPSTGEREDPEHDSTATRKPVAKRRTKTGCLTCRRRRIKCDEGKPRCNNCIKSKRVCDGYNQRVIFKDPMSSYHPSHGSHVFQSASAQRAPPGAAMPAQAHHSKPPFLAPKPPYMRSAPPLEAQNQYPPNGPYPQYPTQNQQPLYPQPFGPSSSGQASSSTHPPPPLPLPSVQAEDFITETYSHGLPSTLTWQQPLLPDAHHAAFSEVDLFANVSSGPAQVLVDTVASAPPNYQNMAATNTDVWTEQQSQVVFDETEEVTEVYRQVPFDSASNWQESANAAMLSEDGAYWYSDDDASLGESDYDEVSGDEAYNLENNDLGAIVSKRLSDRHIDQFGTRMRTFSSYIDVNVLSTYAPSSSSSPLNDDKTAAVFWYFVNVTAPSMSLYDRHPIDSTTLFQGQPVSRARKHIWTYTFPIIALNHPALLQAMLALGGLQMAKLQGVPATASLKHYHLAIRRLARNYQSSFRRVQPATLAATMLLGFYEVWNSDHDKWCKHMWGANAILKEIPLKAMTRKIYHLKRQRRQELESGLWAHEASPLHHVILAEKDIDQVDPVLLGHLAGHHIDIEDDEIVEAPPDRNSKRPASSWTTPDHYTEKDMETYELMGDVFWWYCKMDIYQSILGGTPLLMDFERWTHYLPRGPINHIDAIYGTYDHLIVLLARLCSFSSRDQARKRKAKRPGPPGNTQGQSPPFTGMMPATGRVTVPKGFSPPREMSPSSSESQEEIDFETSTAMALQEWEVIREAFALFRAQLGPDFEPLGPEYELPVSSPFGLALKYRTYGIAGVWMNYNMGLIILQRCHPSMPPVAMAAAGMAARQTAPYANDIGRIMAGITVEDLSNLTHVSTLLAAVFIECSFPIFVAGVQYQDTAQRHWTVRSMHNVARLTGWQSARQIAIGCETAWTKAAQMGRGAPYVPPTDLPAAVQEFIWHRPRRITDRISELNEDDEKVVLSRTEQSHYAIGLLSMESDMEKLELRDNV